jgi:hypothetical protein
MVSSSRSANIGSFQNDFGFTPYVPQHLRLDQSVGVRPSELESAPGQVHKNVAPDVQEVCHDGTTIFEEYVPPNLTGVS